MIREHYLKDAILQLKKSKHLVDRALSQVSDEQFFQVIDPHSNSIAIMVKHLAGNMRSRWTDFLTTDGEKSDRYRDREFEIEPFDTRERLLERWESGWETAVNSISTLEWKDLEKTVTIRGEPHTVIEAINRQLTHYAYHAGQIVFLARHFAGDNWQWLSIPKGKSTAYEVSKEGERLELDKGQ
jgi:hypothetical protein